MGFDINETIATELHYKDISLITIALNLYIETVKKQQPDHEVLNRAEKLINRLGQELYDCPQDKPNGH